jgi:hypothetical protein
VYSYFTNNFVNLQFQNADCGKSDGLHGMWFVLQCYAPYNMSTENIVPATGRDSSRRRFYDGNIALFRAVQSSDWISKVGRITGLVKISETIESKDELSAAHVDALCHQSMLTDSVRG